MDRYQPQVDEIKLRETILCILEHSAGDEFMSRTKLYKLLFFVDFHWYAESGESMTGSTYLRRKHGPVPRGWPLEELEGDIIVTVERDLHGKTQKHPIAKRPADVSVLSQAEINHIDEIISRFSHFNATEVSEESHRYVGWKIADDGEEIPYESIFILHRPLSGKEIEYGRELASSRTDI